MNLGGVCGQMFGGALSVPGPPSYAQYLRVDRIDDLADPAPSFGRREKMVRWRTAERLTRKLCGTLDSGSSHEDDEGTGGDRRGRDVAKDAASEPTPTAPI